jgi:hypothetical protein
LPSADVTADAPATVAGRPGPDLPIRQATAGSISAWSPAEVFGALESSSRGLAAAKAASRLAALGPNELRAAKRPPVIKKVLAQFTNLFALVLLGASVITFASYLIQSPRDTGSLELGGGSPGRHGDHGRRQSRAAPGGRGPQGNSPPPAKPVTGASTMARSEKRGEKE